MEREKTSYTDVKKMYATLYQKKKNITLCFSGKKVNVKPLKVKDKKEILKLIQETSEEKTEKYLENIIEKYVEYSDTDEPINIEQLVDQEVSQLLAEIRACVADNISFTKKCQKCGEINNIKYTESCLVTTNYIPISDTVVGKGNIHVRILPMSKSIQRKYKKYLTDNNIVSDIEKSIVGMAFMISKLYMTQDDILAEVNISDEQKVEFIENLNVDDFTQLSSIFNKLEFGTRILLNYKCKNCGHEHIGLEVPILNFFIK